MITLFTTLKPTDGGIIDTIQYNALYSWLHLPVRIMVFGRESEDTVIDAGLHAAYNNLPGKIGPIIDHEAVNEHGTPLIGPMFKFANACGTDVMCYINADMILFDDFVKAVEYVDHLPEFLMIGHRWNLEVSERVKDFESIREKALSGGVRAVSAAIDYFIHSRELWNSIPDDLTLARFYWDNHLTWLAGSVERVPVIDASGHILAVHQNHPPITSFDSVEAKKNEKIVAYRMAGIEHSTHHLDESGDIVKGPKRW